MKAGKAFHGYQAIVTTLVCIMMVALIGAPVRAEVATSDEAAQTARNWLQYLVHQHGDWAGDTSPQLGMAQEITVDGMVAAFYFPVSPSGYIVVPIIKELPAIKAYSETDHLDVTVDAGMIGLLKDVLSHRLHNYIKFYGDLNAVQPATGEVLLGRNHKEKWQRLLKSDAEFLAEITANKFSPMTTVGPLLTTSWHQGGPYNDLCPMGFGGRTVVGCVATAAAQIMTYWQWPDMGTGDHTYTWAGDNSCDGGTVAGSDQSATYTDAYDWDNILDNYGGGFTAAEADAVSELCYEAAVAFEMDFGVCVSLAYTGDAVSVYPTYFKYDATTIDKEDRDDHTAAEWFAIIQTELNAGRPIQYRIKGHSIVCDGWRDTGDDDEVHMNYGWDNGRNTWYTVDNLHCPWDGCTHLVEYMVRGIQPIEAPPVALCTDVTVQAGSNCMANASIDNGSYDPNDDALTFSQSPSGPYPLGGTFVELTVTDPNGNSDACYATVTVVDNTAPDLGCPGDMTVYNDPGECGAIVDFDYSVSDNCPGVTSSASLPSGSFFDVGTTTVTVSATDASGNSSSCSFTVTVLDTEAPVVNCPADITVGNDVDQCSAVVDFNYSATDNCPGVTAAAVPPSGTAFPVGTTEVTVTATDMAGNTDMCTFTIAVLDTQNPVITCPETIEIEFISTTEATATFEATATDNCDEDPTIVCTPPSGSIFEIGLNTVECVATDDYANADTCWFDFHLVFFDIKPRSCPNPINIKPYTKDDAIIRDLALDGPIESNQNMEVDLAQPQAVVPVAILGSDIFDVKTIDPSTILLNGVAPLRWVYEDVAGPVGEAGYCECTTESADGYMDMTLKFFYADLVASLLPAFDGDVIPLLITGTTADGTPVFGNDCVHIRGPKADKEDEGSRVELNENYPNPFNPITEISFSLPEAMDASLDIYNVLGQRVIVLYDGYLDAGEYLIQWNATDENGAKVSSGIYFYRLTTGRGIISKKMVLLK